MDTAVADYYFLQGPNLLRCRDSAIKTKNFTANNRAKLGVDIDLTPLKSPSLMEATSQIPETFIVKWFSSSRVFITTPPSWNTQCVVFFETIETNKLRRKFLRVRININIPYCEPEDKVTLTGLIVDAAMNDISTVYIEILDIIRKIRKKQENQKDSFSSYREGSMQTANSKIIAHRARKCLELDHLAYLNQYYNQSRWDSSNLKSTDLKVITISDMTPIELLYAVLPIPVMSVLIRGTRTGPHALAARQIISKRYVSLCTEARRQRTELHHSQEFRKFVVKLFGNFKERDEVGDLRKAILTLVENCTARIYMEKPSDCIQLKAAVSKLFRRLLAVQRRTYIERDDFRGDIEKLKTATKDLITSFANKIHEKGV
ncbi:unnamed protein product [Cylicocyclus nassatus]|uniref:Uncharacterized protein n=1 Tax=Cylicocyclus nassatus TaxID=53992 RepID=A0AA36DKM1_CYLNA|nr:unnamed protein product [Cylicocyclus nassatus]